MSQSESGQSLPDETIVRDLIRSFWEADREHRSWFMACAQGTHIDRVEASLRILDNEGAPPQHTRSLQQESGKAICEYLHHHPNLVIDRMRARITSIDMSVMISIWWSRDILPGLDPTARSQLHLLAMNPDQLVRRRVIKALDLMVRDDAQVLSLLIDLLSDPDFRVRDDAAKSLKAWTPTPPLPYAVPQDLRHSVYSLMKSESADRNVRVACVTILARLKLDQPALTTFLRTELQSEWRDPIWREFVISGFAYVCDNKTEVVERLSPLLNGDRPSTAALFALCEYAEHPELPVARMFELVRNARYWKGEHNKLIEVAPSMGPRAVPHLIKVLESDEHRSDRHTTIHALSKCGHSAAAVTQALIKGVERGDWNVWDQSTAVRALNQMAPDDSDVDLRLLQAANNAAQNLNASDRRESGASRLVRDVLKRPRVQELAASHGCAELKAMWRALSG